MENSKIQETIQNFVDATSFIEPKKIPVGAQLNAWPLGWAGMSYAEAEEDAQKTTAAYFKVFDEIEFDGRL